MYKVLIRPLTIEDASTSYHWRNDSEVWKYTGNRPNIQITEEIERNWIVDKLNETNSKRFAIEVEDVYVGNIQLTSITKSEAEFHIFIGNKEYWGKGVANSAIQQILRYADYVLKLDKVYLKVNPEHEKALKLYERCGFIKVDDSIAMEINLKQRNKPMISIFSMVYNHAVFLEKCLDSFLMQKCLFDYEIVIGEDFSKDNSREILLRFQNKYPGKFKLLLHNKNIGAVNNQNLTLKECNGKYIALCEGDDYWTDPYKLQKQVDFLEANSYLSGVATGYQSINKDGTLIAIHSYPENKPIVISTLELIQKNGLATCTAMIRKDFAKSQKDYDFINGQTLGDLSLWLLSSLNGPIYLMPDITAAYRANVGVSSSFNLVKHAHISMKVREDFIAQYPVGFRVKLAYWANKFYYLNQAALKYANNNNKMMAVYYLLKSLLHYPLSFTIKQRLQANNLSQYFNTLKAIL